jgi:hypothetical protein
MRRKTAAPQQLTSAQVAEPISAGLYSRQPAAITIHLTSLFHIITCLSSVLSSLVIHLIIYLVTCFLITLHTVSVYADVILPICGYFRAGFPSDSYTYSATHSVLIFVLPFIKFVSSHTCSLCLFLPSLSALCVLACLV